MAKKQHGTVAALAKKTHSEKMTDNFNQTFDSSDDDAPEEVTFEDSKASALQSIKEALETAKREKRLLKEKRRRRQELFQEQKKRRLLPADILEEIDSVQPKKLKVSAAQVDNNNHKEDDCSVEEESEEDGKETKTKKRKRKSRRLTGNYTVVTVKAGASVSAQQKTAMDFLQARLYGPDSRRTTSSELLSLSNKTGPRKGAAIQFVKKGWAKAHKVKAEKLKRQWIHKQEKHL